MRICNRCNTSKPLTDFYKHNRKASYLRALCKKCCNATSTARKLKYPDENHNNFIKAKYGISRDQYDKLALNGCNICGSKESGYGRSFFAIDHDHSTNKIRGILCIHCNLGLGHFKDNPTVLEKAISYLKQSVTMIVIGICKLCENETRINSSDICVDCHRAIWVSR